MGLTIATFPPKNGSMTTIPDSRQAVEVDKLREF